MKSFLTLILLLLSQLASALPYTCESEELENNKPVLRFRINDRIEVNHNGTIWKHYQVGVTPSKGLRHIVYGSGHATAKEISVTFVKDGFVLGSASAQPQGNGTFYGEARLSGVNKNKTLTIKCEDYKR